VQMGLESMINADEGPRRCARLHQGCMAVADRTRASRRLGIRPNARHQRPIETRFRKPTSSKRVAIGAASIPDPWLLLIGDLAALLGGLRRKGSWADRQLLMPTPVTGWNLVFGKHCPTSPGDGELRLAHLDGGDLFAVPLKRQCYGQAQRRLILM